MSSQRTTICRLAICLLGAGLGIAAHYSNWQRPSWSHQRSGGDTTVFDDSPNAFSLPAPALSASERMLFFVGNSFFNKNWVTAPSSTTARDGLGPLFNARSCSGCHFKDGRGKPSTPDEPSVALLFRLSIEGVDTTGGPAPHPAYGGQVQPLSVPGTSAEVSQVIVTEEVIDGKYADGTSYELVRPLYQFEGWSEGDPGDVRISPRIASAVFGMGLLEAIPSETILEWADPDDSDNDGISGKANATWDFEKKKLRLGRFGWKANQPSVKQQVLKAFQEDIGITSQLFPQHAHASAQKALDALPNGGEPELQPGIEDDIIFYMRTLAVPARRNLDDPTVIAGESLFYQARCHACHKPSTQTGGTDISALVHQSIQPFTDLLLHDMGPGLADGRPDYDASGNEWRTPPLWGLGLISTVNGHTRLLHDGRARNIAEAILWHGGEGQAAREYFRNLNADERAALIAFLRSL